MKSSDCFSPGFVMKAHGLKGALKVKLRPPYGPFLLQAEALFIATGSQLVPYLITECSLKGEMAFLVLDDINDLSKAEELRNKDLYLPLSDFPQALPVTDDINQLIGYKVNDKLKGDIGVIKGIMNTPQQILLEINFNGIEILIPFAPEIVVKMDFKTKTLYLHTPEGLIDLYL